MKKLRDHLGPLIYVRFFSFADLERLLGPYRTSRQEEGFDICEGGGHEGSPRGLCNY